MLQNMIQNLAAFLNYFGRHPFWVAGFSALVVAATPFYLDFVVHNLNLFSRLRFWAAFRLWPAREGVFRRIQQVEVDKAIAYFALVYHYACEAEEKIIRKYDSDKSGQLEQEEEELVPRKDMRALRRARRCLYRDRWNYRRLWKIAEKRGFRVHKRFSEYLD